MILNKKFGVIVIFSIISIMVFSFVGLNSISLASAEEIQASSSKDQFVVSEPAQVAVKPVLETTTDIVATDNLILPEPETVETVFAVEEVLPPTEIATGEKLILPVEENNAFLPIEEVIDDNSAEAEQPNATGEVLGQTIYEALVVEEILTPPELPQLATDKADYAPAETVTIFGKFFQALQNIFLKIFGGSQEEGNYTETNVSVTSDEQGSFTFYHTLDNIFRPLYTIIATNDAGEELAQATFTDGKPAAKIEQCQNGGIGNIPESCAGTNWVTGNVNGSKAHWQEGDFLPYRAILTNLVVGSPNRVTFSYDTAKSSELKHAIDYLGDYDYTETTGDPIAKHANQIDPCSDVIAGCNPASPDGTGLITVSTDNTTGYPASCANGSWVGSIIAGAVKAWNVNGSMTVTFPTPAVDSGATDCPTEFTIEFTPSSQTVVIAWGGHVATNLEWGEGTAVPNGSPYHIHAGFSMESPIGVSYNVGNQDLALASSAITVPGNIIIVKNTIGDNGTFNYAAAGNEVTNFTIDTLVNNSQNFTGLSAEADGGSRTFTETVPTGWELTNLNCISALENSTFSIADNTATISNLGAGDTVTCTFTNTKLGTIIIEKQTNPDARSLSCQMRHSKFLRCFHP